MVGKTQWRCRAWHRWGHGGGSWGAYEHGHAHTYAWWVHTDMGDIKAQLMSI